MEKLFSLRWVLLIFYLAILLIGVSTHDLRGAAEEPLYALIIQDMLENGHYLTPHVNGEIYTDKIPFFFWIGCFIAKLLFGGMVVPFGLRLPSVLAAIGTLLALGWLGRKMFDRMSGFAAPLVLATTLLFWSEAIRGRLDMLLCFFITLSLALFWKNYSQRNETSQSMGSWVFFYLALTGGFFMKGPIGILFPCGIIFFFLLWQKELSFILKMRVVLGTLMLLFFIGGWLLAMNQAAGSSYLFSFFLDHNVNRYANWGELNPLYFLTRIPQRALPWSLILPFAIVFSWKKRETLPKPEYRFLFVWFAVIFLFFSFSSSRYSYYALPLIPALSLYIGHSLVTTFSSSRWQIAIKGMALGSLIWMMGYFFIHHPLNDAIRSPRTLFQKIESVQARNPGKVGCFKFWSAEYFYYGPESLKVLNSQKELATFLKEDKNNLALVNKIYLKELQQKLPLKLLIENHQVRRRNLFVVAWDESEL